VTGPLRLLGERDPALGVVEQAVEEHERGAAPRPRTDPEAAAAGEDDGPDDRVALHVLDHRL
jgi:hypothetical protein